MTAGKGGPEQQAREMIDARLDEAGWVVQDRDEMNLQAGRGVAVREFKLREGHGFADYLLFVDQRAVYMSEPAPSDEEFPGQKRVRLWLERCDSALAFE